LFLINNRFGRNSNPQRLFPKPVGKEKTVCPCGRGKPFWFKPTVKADFP
jgi:hypothetical protein